MTYVEGSSKYSDCAGKQFVSIDDDTDGESVFPLDENGLSSQGILPRRGGVHILKYKVKVAETLYVAELRNDAHLEFSDFPDVPMSFTTEIDFGEDIEVFNVVYEGDNGENGDNGD